MIRLGPLALLAALLAAAPSPAAAATPEEVDVALVLAVDVSWSMDPDEQELQRRGFVDAFRSPAVHDAIRRGTVGRIAVLYLEWANANHQEIVAPWTTLDGPEAALAFAERLGATAPGRAYYTSVSGAIDAGAALLARSGLDAARRVIDVSGDGPNNDGRPATAARDAAVAAGIAINGLPIMLKRPSMTWDIENLDAYYRDCVIGGPGAFVQPVRERSQFAEAIRTKLVREIAAAPDEAAIVPAQAAPPTDCFVGERMRRMRSWN